MQRSKMHNLHQPSHHLRRLPCCNIYLKTARLIVLWHLCYTNIVTNEPNYNLHDTWSRAHCFHWRHQLVHETRMMSSHRFLRLIPSSYCLSLRHCSLLSCSVHSLVSRYVILVVCCELTVNTHMSSGLIITARTVQNNAFMLYCRLI